MRTIKSFVGMAVMVAALCFGYKTQAQVAGTWSLGTNNIAVAVTNTLNTAGVPVLSTKQIAVIIGWSGVVSNNAAKGIGTGTNYVNFEICFDTNSPNATVAGTWFQPTTNYFLSAALNSTNAVQSAVQVLDTSLGQYVRVRDWGSSCTNAIPTNIYAIFIYK